MPLTRQYSSLQDNSETLTAEEVKLWQGRYGHAIEVLGNFCTEVYRKTMSESDDLSYPKTFMVEAEHRFIYPSQPGLYPRGEDSRIINPGQIPRRVLNSRYYEYDESQANGLIRVSYRDFGFIINFSIEESGSGDYHQSVLRVIDEVLPPLVDAAS